MKRFPIISSTVLALGLLNAVHADSVLLSSPPAPSGTPAAGTSVSGAGLAAGVSPFVVDAAPYQGFPGYTVIDGTKWISAFLDTTVPQPPGHTYGTSAAADQNYTFDQKFFVLGSFHLQNGMLHSDNDAVAVFLDSTSLSLTYPSSAYTNPGSPASYYGPDPVTFSSGLISGGTHDLAFVVHNQAELTNPKAQPGTAGYNPVALDFKASIIQPAVDCGVAEDELWPPNHKLVNVGLSAPVTGGSGASTITVMVYSNEADQPSGSKGDDHFSPDATGQGLGTLSLRAESLGTGNGRVYLIIVMAMDKAGNTGYCTSTAVVPHDQSAKSKAAVEAAASQAAAQYEATGIVPAGYVLVGGPGAPVDGPKQ